MSKKAEIYTWSYCPYCKRAKQLLERKNIPYEEYIIDGNDEKKKELFEQTNQDTVPYVFVDGNFIGGFDDLSQMNKEGKL